LKQHCKYCGNYLVLAGAKPIYKGGKHIGDNYYFECKKGHKEDIKELIGKTFEVLRGKDIKKKLPMLNDFNLAMVKGIILGKLK